jgi:hypothetical protein
MSEPLKAAVRAAVLRLLEPLVKWLLDAGIGVGEIVTLVKIAYVRAARAQGRVAGGESKRPNVSRIAVVTGMTRHEVTSLLALKSADPLDGRGRQRAERVLSGWWNDPVFQDRSGKPAALQIRGGDHSFAGLVERYSGEGWLVATILEELLRVGAVRRRADGRVEALCRTVATVRSNAEAIVAFGEELGEHCETLLHNLQHPAQARYVRRVINIRLDPRYVPMLARDLVHQAEDFAEAADNALNAPGHTLKARSKDEPASLGVALYVFESRESESAEPGGEIPSDRSQKTRHTGRPRQ